MCASIEIKKCCNLGNRAKDNNFRMSPSIRKNFIKQMILIVLEHLTNMDEKN